MIFLLRLNKLPRREGLFPTSWREERTVRLDPEESLSFCPLTADLSSGVASARKPMMSGDENVVRRIVRRFATAWGRGGKDGASALARELFGDGTEKEFDDITGFRVLLWLEEGAEITYT